MEGRGERRRGEGERRRGEGERRRGEGERNRTEGEVREGWWRKGSDQEKGKGKGGKVEDDRKNVLT